MCTSTSMLKRNYKKKKKKSLERVWFVSLNTSVQCVNTEHQCPKTKKDVWYAIPVQGLFGKQCSKISV